MKKHILTLLIGIALTCSLSKHVYGQDIYDDTFSRGAITPEPLNTSSPDVVDTDSATWTGTVDTDGSQYETNGSEAAVTPASQVSAALPFSSSMLPSTTSGTLVLSATLTVTSPDVGNGYWEGLGFLEDENGSLNNDGGADWIILEADGDLQGFLGEGVTNQVINTSTGTEDTTSSSTAVLSISLNLATNEVTYSENGTALGTYAETVPLADMEGVGLTTFGYENVTGAVDNFTLTYVAAPEPSVLTLLLAGSVLLAGWRIRRAARLQLELK